MKAAILGATGFIGRHLTDTLIARGDSVSALVRDADAGEELSKKGVYVSHGDASDVDSLRKVFNGAEVVFNLAGALGEWGRSRQEMELVNVHVVRTMVRTAASSGVKRIIHTSTAGVTGPLPSGTLACEGYVPKPMTDYQTSKLEGEKAALDEHRNTGVLLTIVRPTFVYGPGDMHKLSLFRTVASGRMVVVGRGNSSLHPVFVDDVVQGMICAAIFAPGEGEIYILGGMRHITIKILIETIAWALAVPPPKISIPDGILLRIASLAETVGKLAGVEPPLTRSRVHLLSENYMYTIDKARVELGFKPVVSLAEGIKSTVQWYRTKGLIASRSW